MSPTDKEIIAALEAAGVQFQTVPGDKGVWHSTAGSQDVSKIIAGVRALLTGVPEAWGVYARVDGKMVLQYPVALEEASAHGHAGMYGKSAEVEVRPMGVLGAVNELEARAASLWRKWAPYLSKPSRKPFNLARDLDNWMKDTA